MISFERCRWIVVIALCVVGYGVQVDTVWATEVAAAALPTKCVTASTKKMYADYIARFEKDTAAYVGKDVYANAVQAYRSEIDIAWEAMQQPYCGYGTPGLASSIKSFKKTIERARVAFMAHLKKPESVATSTSATLQNVIVAAEAVPSTSPTILTTTSTVVESHVPAKVAGERIAKGLSRGMRSSAVLALQKRLLQYFQLPINADSATGYFGPKTRELVIQFQLDKKLISSRTADGAGMIGPRTVAALNAL